MVNIEETDLTRVDSYVFKVSMEEIPVNKIITLDKNNYDKIDKIIVSNYGNRSRLYFKNVLCLFCYFNNISDLLTLMPGKSIKLPDIESMISELEMIDIFDEYDEVINDNDLVPGINMKSPISNNKNNNSSTNKLNTGNPKLDITLKEVTYNKDSGKIIY